MGRLGGKAYHERGRSHEHQARVPWAVKQMREDILAEQDKPWRNNRNRGEPDYEDEGRPPPCEGDCNVIDEDIVNEEDDQSAAQEEETAINGDNNIIVIDEDAQSDINNSERPEASDMIYIDDAADINQRQVPDIDIGRIKFDP